MEVGGTSPRMGEGRTAQAQLSRVTQDAKTEVGIQCMVMRTPVLDSGSALSLRPE